MHAWISSRVAQFFENKFEEGEVVHIYNFRVRSYRPYVTERCFWNDKYIYITTNTQVVEVQSPCITIPEHVFDSVPLFSLSGFVNRTLHFTG